MTDLAIGSERRLRFGRECRTKLGEAREARARLHGCGGVRLLAGDAQRRAGFARLFCGVLRSGRRLTWKSCGGARGENEVGKAASRAERASNLPRGEKDHAFGLIGSMKETGFEY